MNSNMYCGPTASIGHHSCNMQLHSECLDVHNLKEVKLSWGIILGSILLPGRIFCEWIFWALLKFVAVL